MEKIEKSQDFIKMEHDVLSFWEENKCFEELMEKNKGNKPFRFLDGPITANNPMGVHHAWGRTLKDVFLRYKSMKGHSCHYRNGFDTQGLWVEVEVEKELGFKSKKDIEEYGMHNFTNKCIERIYKFSKIITEQSKRLGQWMNWDNSYYTHDDMNITSIWYFLKKCHNNGWIGQSHRPMPWCPRCGTSLSEHEMSGSYKEIEHKAVFFKLPIKNTNSKILVWTTTPWTLSSNVALAVNPEIEYCEVKVKSDEKTIILAKGALGILEDDKISVERIFKGEELVGLQYKACFEEFPQQQGFEHNNCSGG
jgi:isoleucyl-tRNA synthetase